MSSNIEIIGIVEAAKLYGLHRETLRRLSVKGMIPAAFKVGSHWKYRKHQIMSELVTKKEG